MKFIVLFPVDQPLRSKLDNFHTFGDPMESVLENTVINGETIPAFNIGGEYRLCLPRILRQILSQYHWEQVSPIYIYTKQSIMKNMKPMTLNKWKTSHNCNRITRPGSKIIYESTLF